MKEPIEKRDWVRERVIFLEGNGPWPKEILIKEGNLVSHYRLVKTRSGKFQLVK